MSCTTTYSQISVPCQLKPDLCLPKSQVLLPSTQPPGLFPVPLIELKGSFGEKKDVSGNTICPAPMTPRRLISCAAAIGLELKHLVCLADCSSCLLSTGVIIVGMGGSEL